MKNLLAIICAACLLMTGCGNTEPADTSPKNTEAQQATKEKVEVKRISQDEAIKMLEADPNARLLDCRFPKDYDLRHIPNAINFPLEFAVAENFKDIPDKDSTLITYCGDGNRGGLTAKVLLEKGYKNVYTMGGIIDWEGPVEGTGVLKEESANAENAEAQ